MIENQAQAVTAVNVSGTEADSSNICTCGIEHTFQSLREEMMQQPAPAKKDKSSPAGYHSCAKLWLETTIRICSKLFVCLPCGRENDEEKGISYWCFKEKTQLYHVKRHYMRRHQKILLRSKCARRINAQYLIQQTSLTKRYWIIKRNHAFSLVEAAEFRSIVSNYTLSYICCTGHKLLPNTYLTLTQSFRIR